MSDKKCCECGCKTFEKKSFAWDTCTKCETVWTLSEMIHERKVLEIELSETKDYLNAIFQIMKPLIPACPMTMRKMWAKAMDDGKKIRSEATQQFEELQLQRDRLQQRNKEHEMFRHQHRDCNEMSIDNQKLRAEKKTVQGGTGGSIKHCRTKYR